MRNKINSLLVLLIFLGIAYLVLTFVNLSFDVRSWGTFSRIVFTICGVVAIVKSYEDITD